MAVCTEDQLWINQGTNYNNQRYEYFCATYNFPRQTSSDFCPMKERSSYSQKSVHLHDDDVINHVDPGAEDDDRMNADGCARCESDQVLVHGEDSSQGVEAQATKVVKKVNMDWPQPFPILAQDSANDGQVSQAAHQ